MKNSTSSTFIIVFHLRNLREEKEKKLPVYARITINGRRIELSSKQMMNPEDWNEKRGMAKPINEEYIKLNNYLEQLRNSLIACYREMYLHKKEITTETFKKAYNGEKDDEYTLGKLMDYHNIDMKEALSWGTMKNYYTTQKYLQKFLKEKKHKTDIYLNEINYKFITDFEYYLKTYKPLDHQKRLGNNGTMKHMERFRKMINVALKNEWMEKDPFKAYKPKFIRFERGYLTEEELEIIESKEFTIERLQEVKDLFIFSCYSGLAYIDVVSLTLANIMKGMDNTLWLITQRSKTGTSVKVPLLPKATEIIALRPTLKKAVFHGILSFYPGEKIADEKMIEIAKKYLMNITNTRYVITKHTDKNHSHLHIKSKGWRLMINQLP